MRVGGMITGAEAFRCEKTRITENFDFEFVEQAGKVIERGASTG